MTNEEIANLTKFVRDSKGRTFDASQTITRLVEFCNIILDQNDTMKNTIGSLNHEIELRDKEIEDLQYDIDNHFE